MINEELFGYLLNFFKASLAYCYSFLISFSIDSSEVNEDELLSETSSWKFAFYYLNFFFFSLLLFWLVYCLGDAAGEATWGIAFNFCFKCWKCSLALRACSSLGGYCWMIRLFDIDFLGLEILSTYNILI